MYFHKLDLHLPKLDISKLKGEFLEGYGETFRQYYIKDFKYLEDILKPRIKLELRPDYIAYCEINQFGADPHTDESTVSLNYYINPADCITEFWTKKDPKAVDLKLPQLQIDGTLIENTVKQFDKQKLDCVASFIAKEGEAYLLNIKQIHSAHKISDNTETRKLIRILWNNHNYYNVLNNIKIL